MWGEEGVPRPSSTLGCIKAASLLLSHTRGCEVHLRHSNRTQRNISRVSHTHKVCCACRERREITPLCVRARMPPLASAKVRLVPNCNGITSANQPSRRRCAACGGWLRAIGKARSNGAQHHGDWAKRRYHKQCWRDLVRYDYFERIRSHAHIVTHLPLQDDKRL